MKIWGWSLLALLLCLNGQAQNDLQKELILEIIKEKFHPDGSDKALPATLNTPTERAESIEHKFTTSTSASRSEAEAFIAINPTDTNHLVMSYMVQNNGLSFPVYYSLDGGMNWTASTFDTRTLYNVDFPGMGVQGGGDPVFAFDDQGRLYFSWIYLGFDNTNNSLPMTMYWAWSDDQGKTFNWNAPKDEHTIGYGAFNLNGTAEKLGEGVFDRQWFDMDRSGGANHNTLYVSSLIIPNPDSTHRHQGIILKKKGPSDTHFSEPLVQVSTETGAQFGNIRVDQAGQVHVSYVVLSSGEVFHVRSSDGGKTFPEKNSLGICVPGLGGNNGLKVHGRANAAANLAVDTLGGVYVVYGSNDQDGTRGYFVRSLDQGKTWENRIDLSTVDTTFNGKQSLMPSISATPEGRITISWHALGKGDDTGHYYSITSDDQGSTFQKPLQVSQGATDYTTYNSNAFFGDYTTSVSYRQKTWVVWSDGRDAQGPKMYLGRIDWTDAPVDTTDTNVVDGIHFSQINSSAQWGMTYPNPVKDLLHLNYTGVQDEEVQVSIYTLSGSLVKRWDNVPLDAHEEKLTLSVTDLPAGRFLLRVDGKHTAVGRSFLKR